MFTTMTNLEKLLNGETIIKTRNNDEESWTEFALYDDGGESDEELNEYVSDMELHIDSVYDCTGSPFTQWIEWKRLAVGILVIHKKALDV